MEESGSCRMLGNEAPRTLVLWTERQSIGAVTDDASGP